jgi:hypothetical protein
MIKITVPIIFITLIMSTSSFASPYDLEVNASCSTFGARFNATLPLERGFLSTGIAGIYNDDDYKIADMKLALGGEVLLPEFRFQLGLKGVLGDLEKDHKDGDLMAVGFLLSVKYSLPQTISPLPIDISAGASFSQDPLCFLDSDKYLELRTSIDFRIVESGAVVLGYRYLEVRLDDNNGHWDMSDATLFVGYQLRY